MNCSTFWWFVFIASLFRPADGMQVVVEVEEPEVSTARWHALVPEVEAATHILDYLHNPDLGGVGAVLQLQFHVWFELVYRS